MNSFSAFFALLSLLLFATIAESRIGPGGYDKMVVQKGSVREDLRKLVKQKFEVELNNADNAEKADCHEKGNPKIEFEVAEFEPRPNISAYHDDSEVKGSKTLQDDSVSEAKAKTHAFEEDFEPRPNISVYNN